MVVDKMDLVEFIPKSVVKVIADFASEAQIRYLVGQASGEILSAEYSDNVMMLVQLDSEKVQAFGESLGIYGEMRE